MASRTRQGARASRYPLRFGIAALLLIAGTLVLVLVVLPQRYVLSAGFRESGMSFPTPGTPFLPVEVVPVSARPLPPPPFEIPPGPAELFWADVTPLLQSGRYGAAIPVFETYLAEHPGDADVRRELAVTLLAARRSADAVPVLRSLLSSTEDPAVALLLARTLRDLGRTAEASSEYARLAEARPDDEALTLEWAQAHAWVREFDEAERILRAALSRNPSSTSLRVELARVYYSLGRLEEGAALLADMDDDELDRAGARVLRDDFRVALFVPPEVVVPPPPLTPLEEAVAARVDGDFMRSRSLFEAALAESPDDPQLWRAYADLLEYELADLEGAHGALVELERLGRPDAALQFRLAQIEIWTNRMAEATTRLEALLASFETGAMESGTVSRADVLALLGDLERWEGDRIRAARSYRLALAEEPANQRARDGLAALDAEVRRTILEVEGPRVAGNASSLADTDEYSRVDMGGEWVEVGGQRWVWGGAAGHRWLSGFDLDDLEANRHGVFIDLEVARWWRWGTVRSAVDVGAQRVRGTWDPTFGASLGHRGGGGGRSEVRYEHGPAYPVTNTLQSTLAAVVQDRVLLTHDRPLGDRWSVSVALDAARLRATSDSLAGGSDATGRLLLALSAGRSMTRSITLGIATRALTFTAAAPLSSVGGSGSRPLFWDPRVALSAGPYAQVSRDLTTYWELSARLNPGLALIDERRTGSGYDVVPHFSAEAGLRREGSRLWTSIDLFYYQGQFDGYRTYGARLTFSARDLSTLGGAR